MNSVEGMSWGRAVRVALAGVFSVASLAWAAPQVMSAYVIQFNAPLQTVDVFVGMGSAVVTPPTSHPMSGHLLSRLVETVGQNKHRLLWSMYPASVRGKVFSAVVDARATPFTSMGGW